MKKLFVLILASLVLSGCTEQQRAKGWGGDSHIQLPKGEKMVVVTWKGTDLWFMTRPLKKGEELETYKFRESSSWGVMEGTITIRERAK